MKRIKVFNSIRFRIILILVLTLFIPLIIFSCINVELEKNNYIDSINQSIDSQIYTLNKSIKKYINSIEDDLDYLMEKINQTNILVNINNINQSDIEYIKDNIQILTKNNDDIEHIYLALENGNIYIDDETRIPKGYNPTKRAFYKNTIKSNEEFTLSSIYQWKDEYLLTLSKKVVYNGRVVGVLGIDIDIDAIYKLAKDTQGYIKNQETIILDQENNIVCNTLKSKRMGDKANINEIEVKSTIINGIKLKLYNDKYYLRFEESYINNWKIARLITVENIISEFNKIDNDAKNLLVLIMILVLFILVLISEKIYMPIKYILKMIKKIKNGEYSVNKIYNRNNEFGLIEDSLYKMANDIKIAKQSLEELAYKDLRLGINNRNKFFEKINTINQQGDLVSIILIDINNFKGFNERFGYSSGDEFLMKISDFLLGLLDNNELFRYDGDEFAIILKGYEDKYIENLIIKIQNRFDESWSIRDINYTVSSTIIVLNNIKLDKYSMDNLLNSFEYTMKETKVNKLRLGYVELHNLNLCRKNKIKYILDNCIKNDNLMVYYQPIMNIREDKYTKMEALVRLKDDELGTISPFEFITIAEETGQIYDIGIYIIESVCKKIIELNNNNIHIDAISVNISVVQFMNERFIDDVEEVISKYCIDANKIIFEITESIFINSYDKILSDINKFTKKGIRFALDDFGTGYSSLGNILNLPIDIIKIDKSFIKNIESDKKSIEIIYLILKMCERLELEVIIEGVETKSQLDILSDINGFNIQGYYFSKPIHTKEINNKLYDKNCICNNK